MKINIYYGGRGVIGDPSLVAVKRMIKVFEEINVKVERYDLYDSKTNITVLPQTLKEADGIVLATTVEWHGVGGYMMSFLDACWLYGDKDKIKNIYMAPVVMATTYGEREGKLELINAWETLGGQTCDGICGYISDAQDFEQNDQYMHLIEKSAENIYRSINSRSQSLPVSARVVTQKVLRTKTSLLTQKETEQLSEYISDERYVNQQKADIKELAGKYKGLLDVSRNENRRPYIDSFTEVFSPVAETHAEFLIEIKDKKKGIVIKVDNTNLEIYEGESDNPNEVLSLADAVLTDIIKGRKTFMGAFMEGTLYTRGDIGLTRLMDTMFPFMEKAM